MRPVGSLKRAARSPCDSRTPRLSEETDRGAIVVAAVGVGIAGTVGEGEGLTSPAAPDAGDGEPGPGGTAPSSAAAGWIAGGAPLSDTTARFAFGRSARFGSAAPFK